MPSPRREHSAIFDEPRGRMVVFGGSDSSSYFDETWIHTLGGTPSWSPLATQGGPPTPRFGHSAILDAARHRMLVFGGYDGDLPNDLHDLSLDDPPVWTALAPSGNPPGPRMFHSAILDPVRERMIVFGGLGAAYDEVWALSLAGPPAWTELIPAGDPAWPRWGHAAIYDPVRDRMIVFGGLQNSPEPYYLNDTWELSLAGTPRWTELAPLGQPPPERRNFTAVYDPVRDRMVVFGGYGGYPIQHMLNDVWELSLAGTPRWTELAPSGLLPVARNVTSAVYERAHDRMVLFGGWDGSRYLGDTWYLSWGQPTVGVVTPVGTARLSLARVRPNPVSGPLRIGFELPDAAAARLELLDVGGRRVAGREVGTLGAGRHEVELGPGAARPGVYFVRLTRGGRSLATRVCLVR